MDNNMQLKEKIKIIKGDITTLDVDVIVNAANKTLLGGGGVDGDIHRKAGVKLLAECATLGGCKTGEAKITKGYNLLSRHVIHTPGPVWHGGKKNEDILLANSYNNSLKLAVENNLRTIAFPSISTGVYGYPIEKASKIAILETIKFLENNPSIEEVTFVCFSSGDFKIYQKNFQDILEL